MRKEPSTGALPPITAAGARALFGFAPIGNPLTRIGFTITNWADCTAKGPQPTLSGSGKTVSAGSGFTKTFFPVPTYICQLARSWAPYGFDRADKSSVWRRLFFPASLIKPPIDYQHFVDLTQRQRLVAASSHTESAPRMSNQRFIADSTADRVVAVAVVSSSSRWCI